MAEPTLTNVLGSGASQTATTITIDKNDLATVGLTPDANNAAESLLAAMILLAKNSLTEVSFGNNPDQSITITNGFDSIIQRDDGAGNLSNVRQNQLTINFHKPDAGAIDPDDYASSNAGGGGNV